MECLPIPVEAVFAAWPVLAGREIPGSPNELLLPGRAGGWALSKVERLPDGFSGAVAWRLESGGGRWVLRRWPETGPDLPRLEEIRSFLATARENGCRLVVVPERASGGAAAWRGPDGAWWQLTAWLPGESQPSPQISPQQFRSAVAGVAGLLNAWRTGGPESRWAQSQPGLSDALRRFAGRLQDIRRLAGALRPPDPLRMPRDFVRLALATAEQLEGRSERLYRLGESLAARSYQLQPVLTDLWRENVLFDGERISGIIDYGSLAIDTPLVTWARLIGSFEFSSAAGWGQPTDSAGPPEEAWAVWRESTPVALESALGPDPEKQGIAEPTHPGEYGAGYAGGAVCDRHPVWLVKQIMEVGAAVACLHWLDSLFLQNRNFATPERAWRQAGFWFRRFLSVTHGGPG